MYFWNTKALSEDIKNNNLTDNDWKNYYLAGSIIITISMYLTSISPRIDMTSVLTEAILMIGILIFGVSITFNTHQDNDSSIGSYISKMTALSLPLMVKFFVLAFVVGLLFGIAEAADISNELIQTWGIVVMSVSIQSLLFWRLNVHLASINT